MRVRSVVKGALTFVPGVQPLLSRGEATGGTDDPYYCYGVWLKHLTLSWEQGLRDVPETFAELGPGDSLGIGLAAMLSGVERYYALDVVRYADPQRNLRLFDALLVLFAQRQPAPTRGWPDFGAHLDAHGFPSHILSERRLARTLSDARIAAIRRALAAPDQQRGTLRIEYKAPWHDERVVEAGSVDYALSHSVMEHVVDVEGTYDALYRWLRPGGLMSHQIDFTAHKLSKQWDGYRACPELLWKITAGRRPYLLNREPPSTHVRAVEARGFELLCGLRNHRPPATPPARLAKRWRSLSPEDAACAGVFILARKPAEARVH